MGVKTESKENGKLKGICEEERNNREKKSRKERKDSYKENMLRRKGGCQAVAVL